MTMCLAAALAPLLAFTPASIPFCQQCPQVTEIHHAASARAFNIVFLSSGFATDDELEVYRCAVQKLASGLLASKPWSDYACSIGVYRIDARAGASGIGVDDGCENCVPAPMSISPSDICLPKIGGVSLSRIPIWPEITCDVANTDIDVRHCNSGVCELVWPTDPGKTKALYLATTCAPSPSAIVIVANSNLVGGGADLQLYASGPEIAVVTIDNIRNSDAWHRLGHEIGHVLGLLDEYAVGASDPFRSSGAIEYQCGRNLYSPELAGTVACSDTNTWENSCTSPGSLTCPPPSSGKCQIVCAPPCPAGDPMCHRAPCCFEGSPAVALVEGGFYQQYAVFHSADTCMMNNYKDDLCPRCLEFASDFLEASIPHCLLRPPHNVEVRMVEDVDIERCGTVPHPPLPPTNLSAQCGELSNRVLGFRARVKLRGMPGIFGEVPVRKATFTVSDPTRPNRSVGYELSVTRKSGASRLQWTRRKRAVQPSNVPITAVPDRPDVVRLGTLVGPVTVVDDVTGASWDATDLIITTQSDSPQ